MKRLLVGLVFAVAIAGPVSASEPGLWKDWMAGCDQAKHCRALALPPEDTDAGLILVLDRASGPLGLFTIRLTTAAGLKRGPVRLVIDGEAFDGRVEADADSAIWDGEGALLLARALAAGSQADATQAGKSLGKVSLAGAAAALLFVDDAQTRAGTKGALARPGRKSDDAAAITRPTVFPYPGLRNAPAPASLAAVVRKQGALNGMDCNDVDTPTDAAIPLDGSNTLVLLECSSGAYNLLQQPFLVQGDVASTARPIPGDLSAGVTNADFDPRYRTLGGLAKGRGTGDCGSIDRWAWTGKAFVRVQRTVMDVCRGVPPQWWITIDRSAMAVAL